MHLFHTISTSASWPSRQLTRIAYHTMFWLALFVFMLYFDDSGLSFGQRGINEFINLLFYAVLVYFNLNYLIPNYLTKNKFLTYLLLLVTSALILTPLKIIILYFRFAEVPALQQNLIGNLNLYFILTFFIGSGSTILKIITEWFRQLRHQQELETQTMQSELRFLKSQINPHFLFNTLNNLYALTLKKSDKAPDIVIKLSEMMRYMLYECNEKQVPLYKEVNYLRNYLDLERLRQSEHIKIEFNVEGVIGDQKVAPLLFIPFLENSFKHGLNTQLKDGFVKIQLNANEEMIDFYIENSKGQAVLAPANRPSGGIGLVNVRRRLELLYPDHYTLEVSNKPNSFSVHITVDLDEQ